MATAKPVIKKPVVKKPIIKTPVKKSAVTLVNKPVAIAPGARMPSQAAKEIQAYASKAGANLGRKGNPSPIVLAAQRDMGGVVADGIYGPNTSIRANALMGLKPITKAVNKPQQAAVVRKTLAIPRTAVQAARDLQVYVTTHNVNLGKRGKISAAVQAAQRDMGMGSKSDGIYGPATQSKMNSLLGVSNKITQALSGAPQVATTPKVLTAVSTFDPKLALLAPASPATVADYSTAQAQDIIKNIPAEEKQAALDELQNFMASPNATEGEYQEIVQATPALATAALAVASTPVPTSMNEDVAERFADNSSTQAKILLALKDLASMVFANNAVSKRLYEAYGVKFDK